MEIKSFSNSINFQKENIVKKPAVKQEGPKDRIEISAEAAKKLENESASKIKNLDEIRKKIDNKFYNSEEVIGKVADKILKEIFK